MNNRNKIILAAGALTAAAVMLLFTTKEGKKLRQKAKDKGKKIMEDLEKDLKCRKEESVN